MLVSMCVIITQQHVSLDLRPIENVHVLRFAGTHDAKGSKEMGRPSPVHVSSTIQTEIAPVEARGRPPRSRASTWRLD